MKKGNKIYFAPDYTFGQLLKTSEPSKIIEAYAERINGFYLDVIDAIIKEDKENNAFVAGMVCFAAIDAIARTVTGSNRVGERFKLWIKNLSSFKTLQPDILERVYDEYRNGLIHEARIKNGGQFTYQIQDAIEIKNKIISINPRLLLDQLRVAFDELIKEANSDRDKCEGFGQKIIRDFHVDLNFLKGDSVQA